MSSGSTSFRRIRKERKSTVKLKHAIKHGLYQGLNRPAFRPVLAGLVSMRASMRLKKRCRVSYDGDWVQEFPSGTLVEPRLTLWTPEEIEKSTFDYFLYKYLPKEGDTIVDVGAGTGWETLTFSKLVGPSGRVISIEAHPTTYDCLAKMCAKNGLKNVTPLHVAVGDQEGEVKISDTAGHEANSIVNTGSGVSVRATTLDSIFRTNGLTRVDFLKMNIEGAEKLALPGMQEMAKKTKCVCIACHDFLADEGGSDDLRTKADVIRFLENNGFKIFLRDNGFYQNFVYGVNEKLVTA